MVKDEHCAKAKAMAHLLRELEVGIRSGEEDGWLTAEDIRAHLHEKKSTSAES